MGASILDCLGSSCFLLAEASPSATPTTSIGRALSENLLAPIPLCFALGIFCNLIQGGIKIPKELYYTISIFLLMRIGFMGGYELALADIKEVAMPALVTLFLGCVTPISAYVILHYIGRLSAPDSAGIAAHYGSTSAVTFAVAQQFVDSQGHAMDGYLPTLVTILECPGIAVALAIGPALTPKAAELLTQSPGARAIPAVNWARPFTRC